MRVMACMAGASCELAVKPRSRPTSSNEGIAKFRNRIGAAQARMMSGAKLRISRAMRGRAG
jgi:hypothetical protein